MHPCRKLVLTDLDEKILSYIKKNRAMSFETLLEVFDSIPKQQLKKRIIQFKKHELIKASADLRKISIHPNLIQVD